MRKIIKTLGIVFLSLLAAFAAVAQGTFAVTITGGPMYNYTLVAEREVSPGSWSSVGSVVASSAGTKNFTSGGYGGPGAGVSINFRIAMLYSGGLVYICSPQTVLTGSGAWTYTGTFSTTGYGLYSHVSGSWTGIGAPAPAFTNYTASFVLTNSSPFVKTYTTTMLPTDGAWFDGSLAEVINSTLLPGQTRTINLQADEAFTYTVLDDTVGSEVPFFRSGSGTASSSPSAPPTGGNPSAGTASQGDPFTNPPALPGYSPPSVTNAPRATDYTTAAAQIQTLNANNDARANELRQSLNGLMTDQRNRDASALLAAAQQAYEIGKRLENLRLEYADGTEATVGSINTLATNVLRDLGIGFGGVTNSLLTNAMVLTNQLTQLTNLVVANSNQTATLSSILTNLYVSLTNQTTILSNRLENTQSRPGIGTNGFGVGPSVGDIPTLAASTPWPNSFTSIPSGAPPVFTFVLSGIDSRLPDLVLDFSDATLAAWVAGIRAFLALIVTVMFFIAGYRTSRLLAPA